MTEKGSDEKKSRRGAGSGRRFESKGPVRKRPVKRKKVRRRPARKRTEQGEEEDRSHRPQLPPPLPPRPRGERRRPGSIKKRRKRKKHTPFYSDFVKIITSEYSILSFLGVIIGVLSAMGAWFFREMIGFFREIFLGSEGFLDVGSILDYPYGYLTILAPILGGLVVGLIAKYLAPEVRGSGMPEVMEAVAIKGGKIRSRVIALKALASSITVGSGGSAGREGPIVQIGSAIGSMVGQRFEMPEGWTKILVACGATGAITATFNTPIAGVIFALELILIELKTRSFIPMVVTAVTSKVVSIRLLGDTPAFQFTEVMLDTYILKDPKELLIYLFLGFLAGIVAVIFTKSLYSIRSIFLKAKLRPETKPMLGGLFIAMIALVFPQILGVGYETVDAVLAGNVSMVPLYLMVALIFVKIIATSLTVGSGGSGGIFSPSLFIGAMLGGTVGTVANMMFPGMTGPAGAYAVVGMAALFAGAARATFTSMIIVFEMTLNYDLILPVMFACVISDGVSSVLKKETIFTEKLAERGVRILHDMEVNLLEILTVREAMVREKDVYCAREDETLADVYNLIMKTEHMGFPVMDKDNKCCGIITFHDVDRAMSHGYFAEPIKWFCTKRPVVTYEKEDLERALQKMRKYDISHLPVVSRKDKGELRGFITKGDILQTYAKKHIKEYGAKPTFKWLGGRRSRD